MSVIGCSWMLQEEGKHSSQLDLAGQQTTKVADDPEVLLVDIKVVNMLLSKLKTSLDIQKLWYWWKPPQVRVYFLSEVKCVYINRMKKRSIGSLISYRNLNKIM